MGCFSYSCLEVKTDENYHRKEFRFSQTQRQNTQRNNRYPPGNSVTIEENKIIISQMIKYVCKIYQTEEDTATGFMCKIPYQNQLLPVLITNNHVLNEEKIKIGQTIRFSFNEDQIEKTIKIDNSRKKIYESYKRYNYFRNKEKR